MITLLNELMEEDTAGDPMSTKKWSRKDTRLISRDMKARGVSVCPNTAGKLLKDQDYSLRLNRKSIAETQHPDRNSQFEIIAEFRRRFEDAGEPIISVDTKKKELIGNFKNPGRTWAKNGEAVLTHDFRSDAKAIASPYGLYEPIWNLGTVVVGTSSDTPEFAVDCLDMWMSQFGWQRYLRMKEILILCDSGGSNGYRSRFWKYGLHTTIAKRHGVTVTVCHYPPGTSKWNPIEHRLFSFISMEWAGHPLRSLDVMLDYIRGTTTKTGLKVAALLNDKHYSKGKKISDSAFRQIPLRRHSELPAWNYMIFPN